MSDKTKPLLLVEDTGSLAMVYMTLLRKAGYDVERAETLAEATALHEAGAHQVVLLDLLLPDGDGLRFLEQVDLNKTRVLVITANGSINKAVEAMRLGAFDFLVKPFDESRLLQSVRTAIEVEFPVVGSTGSSRRLRSRTGDGLGGFVGSSSCMSSVYQTVGKVGQSTATVFITGESGTGKEVCARAIHDVSPRRKKPFIALNCGAIPENLLESEVFGHLKGSFTGAIADKAGAAVAANGGTLFLDEICEMDLPLQTKLLRFLQTSSVQPVGANRPQKVDVRILCATNRDPAGEVRAGRFREDLFYRLHVVPIHLPPLRDRDTDVVELAESFLKEFAALEGKSFRGFDAGAVSRLRAYSWPGNVRELQNVIRNVVVLNEGPQVVSEMLPLIGEDTREPIRQAAVKIASSTSLGEANWTNDLATDAFATDPLSTIVAPLVGYSLEEVERTLIEATIARCDGSIPKAAKMLDVSPSTIYRKREAWLRQTA